MSILFDGSSGYIDAGNNLDSTANMTISCWMRKSVAGARLELVSKEGDFGPPPAGWVLAIQSSNVAHIAVQNGGFAFVDGTTSLAINTTYHIVGVRDSAAGLLRIYVNGVQENTASAGAAPNTSPVNINIGRRPDNTRYMDGQIEDVRVYNRALSAGEIETLYYSRGRDKIVNGLVGRWPLTESPPSSFLDGFAIQNVQSASEFNIVSDNITLSYTVPSGIPNPVLVVSGGGENTGGSAGTVQPSAATFGATSMTKRAGTNTTSGTIFAGSAIFTLGTTAGASGTITLTFPAAFGSGGSGRIMHAFVVANGSDGVNVTNTNFANSGNTTVSFTTTAARKIGITHHFTGNADVATGTSGTDHTQLAEVSLGSPSANFSSRIGFFNAESIQTYSDYGFTFGPAPNRSAISMIALNRPTSSIPIVYDVSESRFDGTPLGILSYAENMGIFTNI